MSSATPRTPGRSKPMARTSSGIETGRIFTSSFATTGEIVLVVPPSMLLSADRLTPGSSRARSA